MPLTNASFIINYEFPVFLNHRYLSSLCITVLFHSRPSKVAKQQYLALGLTWTFKHQQGLSGRSYPSIGLIIKLLLQKNQLKKIKDQIKSNMFSVFLFVFFFNLNYVILYSGKWEHGLAFWHISLPTSALFLGRRI